MARVALIPRTATLYNPLPVFYRVRVVMYREAALEEVAREVARVIREGGVAIIPTDTCYGLAADAASQGAVVKVFKVKRRPWSKPISIFLDSVDTVRRMFVVDEIVERALSLLPGHVTLILRLRRGIVMPRGIDAGGGRVGVRVSPHPLSRAVAAVLGRPITATSANRSGRPPVYEASKAARQLPEADLLVDAGTLPRIPPSTVVDLTVRPPRILRVGPVPPRLIEQVLGVSLRA